MIKKLLPFTMLFIFYKAFGEKSITTRASLGPGWLQFMMYERFNLTPEAIELSLFTDQETTTDFNVFPYLEGRINGKYNHVYAQLLFGGGILTGGRGQVITLTSPEEGTSFPNDYSTKYSADIFTTDITVGTPISLRCAPITFTPQAGYILNKEKIILTSCLINGSYTLYNTWNNGYIGAAGTLATCPLDCTILYKVTFGSVTSALHTRLPIISLPPLVEIQPRSQPPFSKRHVTTRGSQWQFELCYKYSPCLHVGSNVTYSHYRNHTLAKEKLGPGVEGLVTSACLKNITLNQCTWTFFVEYIF